MLASTINLSSPPTELVLFQVLDLCYQPSIMILSCSDGAYLQNESAGLACADARLTLGLLVFNGVMDLFNLDFRLRRASRTIH